ncbi:MAG: S1/P1 Nuclease [Alphaproteobacteria bacterium]
MRNAARLAAVALCFALAPHEAGAWGATGHRLIGEDAIKALPDEVPAFLRGDAAAAAMGELAREPDRWKGAGATHDGARDPGHFLDLDDFGRVNGGPLLSALPVTREDYESALRAAGTDSTKSGWLPYSIIDNWQQIVRDFALWRAAKAGVQFAKGDAQRFWLDADASRREQLILRDIGEFAHYVGDGSQPLHVTVHYDGWGPGPNPSKFTEERIHARFEGAFVRDNATEASVLAAMPPYHDCKCEIAAATAQYLRATNTQVAPLYTIEKKGSFKAKNKEEIAFATARLAAGAAELRDLIVDAWHASGSQAVGYPPTPLADVESGKVDAYALLYGND